MAQVTHTILTTRDEELRDEIRRWRRGRHARAPLPAGLWSRATDVAKRLGAYGAAKALGLSYESLRARLDEAGGNVAVQAGPGPSGAFLELSGGSLGAAPGLSWGTEVVVRLPDSVEVRVRLGTGERLDVGGLVQALRRGVGE